MGVNVGPLKSSIFTRCVSQDADAKMEPSHTKLDNIKQNTDLGEGAYNT